MVDTNIVYIYRAATGYMQVYPIKRKKYAYKCLKKLCTYLKHLQVRTTKTKFTRELVSDRGGLLGTRVNVSDELKSIFNKVCKKRGSNKYFRPRHLQAKRPS